MPVQLTGSIEGQAAAIVESDLTIRATIFTEDEIAQRGASAGLVRAFADVDPIPWDKPFVAPRSQLPAFPAEIARAIEEQYAVESDPERRDRLGNLYVAHARYGSDDDARFLQEYWERRGRGPHGTGGLDARPRTRDCDLRVRLPPGHA